MEKIKYSLTDEQAKKLIFFIKDGWEKFINVRFDAEDVLANLYA